MKIIILLAALASGNLFASTLKTQSCRSAIVDAQRVLGHSISEQEFSSRTFEEFNMSAQEFNELNSERQAEIYMQIKPLQIMLNETISDLNSSINYYADSFYAFFMVDEIQEMREHRTNLRSCSMEE